MLLSAVGHIPQGTINGLSQHSQVVRYTLVKPWWLVCSRPFSVSQQGIVPFWVKQWSDRIKGGQESKWLVDWPVVFLDAGRFWEMVIACPYRGLCRGSVWGEPGGGGVVTEGQLPFRRKVQGNRDRKKEAETGNFTHCPSTTQLP